MSTLADDHRALIRHILSRDFSLKVLHITPLGHGHRNIAFLVDIRGPTNRYQFWERNTPKPGTVPIPEDTARVIFRFCRPGDPLIKAARAENTVAAMSVARSALSQNHLARLVPRVYGWNSGEYEPSRLDWVLEEYMPGQNLAEDFPSLKASKQRIILAQMADAVKAFQVYQLPDAVTPFGGLSFDRQGEIQSGGLSFRCIKNHVSSSIDSFYRGMINWGLEESQRCGMIQRGSPLKRRLERFAQAGVAEMLHKLPKGRPTFIQGNLEPIKTLYDPETFRITAILDYSFSHVAIPVVEFLYSFTAFSGFLPGPFDKRNERMRYAMLYGFPNVPPPMTASEDLSPLTFDTKRSIQWGLAKAWEDELSRAQVLRPRTTHGADLLSQLHSFIQNLAPWSLCDDDTIESRTDEQLVEALDHAEETIEKYLGNWGY